TVQEVIAAVHGGMRVLGLSTITNVHNPDDPTTASIEDIIEVAKGATSLLKTIIEGVAGQIYETEIR
ncbi:MAG: purine-nucleoside phosphorylase, partial [Desulfobacterales bacterium]